MKQTASSKASSIEANIQEKHLRDAEADKQQITAKLGAVKDAIKIYKNSKVITEAISKPKLMSAEERARYEREIRNLQSSIGRREADIR